MHPCIVQEVWSSAVIATEYQRKQIFKYKYRPGHEDNETHIGEYRLEKDNGI